MHWFGRGADPFEAPASNARLLALYKARVLSQEEWAAGLAYAARSPDAAAWRRFLALGLLGAGVSLILSGLMYFFAFNWDDLHRMAQFSLAGAWVLTGFGVAYRYGFDGLRARWALLVSAVGVGAWLALIGQTFQTGADHWTLYALWAGLIAPWALGTRFEPLLLLEVILINLGLYFGLVRWLPDHVLWIGMVGALVNGAVWSFWIAGHYWFKDLPVPHGILALVTLVPLLPAAVLGAALGEWELVHLVSGGALVGSLVLFGAGVSRTGQGDRLPAVIAGTLVLIFGNVAFGRWLFQLFDSYFGLLGLAVAVAMQGAALVAWLNGGGNERSA